MHRPHAHKLVIAAALIAAAATPALANPGTAMMWPVVIHFVVGNLIIGVVEWIGLCFFGASKLRAALMLPANYASGFLGIALARQAVPQTMLTGDAVVANIVPASLIALAAFALIGVLVEMPFVALSFRAPRRMARMLLACVVVNAVTSVGLAWYYNDASDLSFAHAFRVVPLTQIEAPADAWIYAIAPDERTVERFRLDASERSPFTDLPRAPRDYSTEGYTLSAVDLDADARPDLVYHQWDANRDVAPGGTPRLYPDEPPLDPRWRETDDGMLFTVVAPSVGQAAATHQPDPKGRHSSHPLAADLRPESARDPDVIEGMGELILRHPDGRTETLTLLSPLTGTSAAPKAITALPGNVLVLELGGIESRSSRGVYLADLNARTIAYIGPGRSPVVVLDPPMPD